MLTIAARLSKIRCCCYRNLMAVRNMRIPFAAKLSLSAALLAVASLALFGYLTFRQQTAMVVDTIREELAATVRNGAAAFAPNDLADPSASSVKRMQEQLDVLLERNPRDKEFHLFAIEGKIVTLLASSSGADAFVIPAEGQIAPQEVVMVALRQAVRTDRTSVTPLYSDNGRLWVTAFSPIAGPDKRPVAVLAADREAVEYGQAVDAVIAQTLYYSIAALLVALLLGMFVNSRITLPLRRLHDAAIAAAEGRFKPLPVKGNDEVATLTRRFNETNITLEHKIAELAQLTRELEERVAARTDELSRSYDDLRRHSDILQREMNTARRVQETIIPKGLRRQKIDIEVAYVPILEIGGDLGLTLERSPSRYDVAIGDVTGHGIGAALVGNRVHTLLTSLYATDAPLDSIIHRLDYFLSEEISDIGMFLTLMAMRFDLDRMVLECAGGGHVAALHYKRSGTLSEVEGRCGIIGAGNLFCDADPVAVVPIESGDCILLYTDGIVDCTNPAGEAFSKVRLSSAFTNAAARTRDNGKIAPTLVSAAKDFTGGRFQDDVLLLAIQIK